MTGVELPLLSQVVKLSESEMTQYRSADGANGANAKPASYLYASIRTGPTGTLNGTNPPDLNVAATGFTYPSLDFVFSVGASDAPVEGLHRCAALLEVPVDVTVLRVTVSLITDWKHFGPWQKSFTFHVPVPTPKK